MRTISPVSAERLPPSGVARAMREHPIATIFATGFGAGFSPIAPGTAGSSLALAAGWIAVASLTSHMPSVVAAVGLLTSGLVIAFAAIPVTGRVAEALGDEDPGCIVLDEIAGQLLASAPVPMFGYATSRGAAAAWIVSFLAFRLFDVWKPGPIRGWQRLPGGRGIVIDDVAAGLLAAATTAVVAAFL